MEQVEFAVRKAYMPAVLSILTTFGFFGTLAYILYSDKPVADNPVLLVMLGTCGSGWGTVMSYYFGSNSGSGNQASCTLPLTPTKQTNKQS